MNPLNIHVTICASFTAAVAALAAALASKAEGTPTNIIPINTGGDLPSIANEEDAPKRGRKPKAEKEEAPVVKVDQTKRLEELCEKAKDKIKSLEVNAGRALAAKCKELAQTLGADKLSALKPTAEILDKAEAGLDNLIAEATEQVDDDV